ncbi:putative cytoplasmic protein [Vibrio sp. JCM 18905]|nr:putative cytoplasmic protein [Vibrio sp. JCM 18905]
MQTVQQLQQRLEKVQDRLESDEFLTNKELGGEIGFYIFDYPAEHEIIVREHIDFLTKKLASRSEITGKRFASINLFEMVVELLKSRKLLDRAYKMQFEKGDDALFKALKGPLEQNRFAEFIVKQANVLECDFIILHGLGSVWPIIRGHGLLNALHAKVGGNVPTVMFYPGEYDGATLKPFGRIESNNYYRAFKLVP